MFKNAYISGIMKNGKIKYGYIFFIFINKMKLKLKKFKKG